MMLEGEASVRVDGVKEPTTSSAARRPSAGEDEEPVIKTLKDCVWLEVTFPTKPEVG
jgi:hypothetical protein